VTAAAGAGSTATWGGTCTAAGGAEAGNGTGTATCTFASLDGNKTATATFNAAVQSCLGAGPYRLWGTVYMKKKGNLSGVTMTLVGPGGCTDTMTVTTKGGNYQFPTLGRGEYTVTPSKPGCTFMPASRTVRISGNRLRMVGTFIGKCL